jgi:hypothetical protein
MYYQPIIVFIFSFTLGLRHVYALIPSNPLGKMIYNRGLLSTFVNKITFEIADDGVMLSQFQYNNFDVNHHHNFEYFSITCIAYIAYKYIQIYNVDSDRINTTVDYKLTQFAQYKIAQRHAKAFVVFIVLLMIKNIEPVV